MFKRAWTDSDMLICWYMLIQLINHVAFHEVTHSYHILEGWTSQKQKQFWTTGYSTLLGFWHWEPHESFCHTGPIPASAVSLRTGVNWYESKIPNAYTLSLYIYIIYIWYNYYNQWGFHTFKVCSYPLWLCAFIMIPRKAKKIATSRKKRKSEANNNLTS